MPLRVAMNRAPFPPLRAQSEENEQLENLATLLLDEYVEQYDHCQLQPYGLLRTDWTPLMQRGELDIYQQRKPSSDDGCKKKKEVTLPRLLATGTIHASLEDVMFATLAPTSEAMHVKMAATPSGDDLDGLVLHTVTPVTAAEPFRYCGVKWLLRRAKSGLQSIVRKRDFVFLEATGIKVRPDGERIGFHLCHSIEFATTPQLARRGIVRGKMATCHFYRELSPSKVDVWAVATLDMQGAMWRRVAIAEGAAAMGSIRELPMLALTKKVLWFQENRPPVLSPRESTATDAPNLKAKGRHSSKCFHCGKDARWLWKKHRRCGLCSVTVCSTCSESITVFPSGLDPRSNRDALCCCFACVGNLAEYNQAVYASQSCLDPSQRGSAQSTGAFCEDIRPKYEKGQSKFLPTMKKKKKTARRGRTCSSESSTTLTSSIVSRQSAVACPDQFAREPVAPFSSLHYPLPRRGSATGDATASSRVNLADALRHLQAVADATYEAQQENSDRFAPAAVYECQPPRRLLASSPRSDETDRLRAARTLE